jgi:hypothetical protein
MRCDAARDPEGILRKPYANSARGPLSSYAALRDDCVARNGYLLGRNAAIVCNNPALRPLAVMASGGLSHFVVDEDLDRRVIEGFETGRSALLRTLPVAALNSGSSEIRNWIVVAGAIEGMERRWLEYQPLYRTPAGPTSRETDGAFGRGTCGDPGPFRLPVRSERETALAFVSPNSRYVDRPPSPPICANCGNCRRMLSCSFPQ